MGRGHEACQTQLSQHTTKFGQMANSHLTASAFNRLWISMLAVLVAVPTVIHPLSTSSIKPHIALSLHGLHGLVQHNIITAYKITSVFTMVQQLWLCRGLFFRTTWVRCYQKCITSLDFK